MPRRIRQRVQTINYDGREVTCLVSRSSIDFTSLKSPYKLKHINRCWVKLLRNHRSQDQLLSGLSFSDVLKEAECEIIQLKGRIGKKIPFDMLKKLDNRFARRFVCQHCGKSFAKSCALGGHVSKMHSSYDRKQSDVKLKAQLPHDVSFKDSDSEKLMDEGIMEYLC